MVVWFGFLGLVGGGRGDDRGIGQIEGSCGNLEGIHGPRVAN